MTAPGMSLVETLATIAVETITAVALAVAVTTTGGLLVSLGARSAALADLVRFESIVVEACSRIELDRWNRRWPEQPATVSLERLDGIADRTLRIEARAPGSTVIVGDEIHRFRALSVRHALLTDRPVPILSLVVSPAGFPETSHVQIRAPLGLAFPP